MNLNKVLLAGHVGSVEVKQFETGRKLVQISLATTDGYKKGDTYQSKTEWHRIIMAIPALAEKAAEAIGKGDTIYVEGSITTNSWVTKDGTKKEIREISCTTYKMLKKAIAKDEKEWNQPNTHITNNKKEEQW
jgi:single-strand DNA-binding protein